MTEPMTSSRPYLVRAIYQWIVDNGLTPHLLVDASNDDVMVPSDYVEGGRVVMNIAPMAVQGLTLGNEEVTFSARFRRQADECADPRAAGDGHLYPGERPGHDVYRRWR
jgi:stringent starvation protein B